MSNLEFVSEITVHLTEHAGSDYNICASAWVSSGTQPIDATLKRQRGLIRALLRDKHGSPFESGFLEFYIDAPRAVRDEHVRHRVGSYSSSSLRFQEGNMRVWIPPQERGLARVEEGFKQIQPRYEPLNDKDYEVYVLLLKQGYQESFFHYKQLREFIPETEAVRWLTWDGLMTPYIARFNPRSLMHFLSLRTHRPEANHVSYPMWEIAIVAEKMETVFAQLYPLTWEAYNEYGREAP